MWRGWLLLWGLLACGGKAAPPGPYTDFVVGGARPVTVHVPRGFDPSVPTPLLLVLHGYGSSGDVAASYLGLAAAARQRGLLLAAPDGARDHHGAPFWNASDGCCDLDHLGVDDSTYLDQVITDIAARVAVDPHRVFVAGHSNGGFMAFRLACDHAEHVSAIVSVEGAMPRERCAASRGVSVLAIHGTRDNVVPYAGGSLGGLAPFPGAAASVAFWQPKDRCRDGLVALGEVDVEAEEAGRETIRSAYPGCADGLAVELWTVVGGGHVPWLVPAFGTAVVDWLLAHPR